MNTILFDMDGTLFDTEKHYQWAWRKAIADAGYELDASEVLKLRSLGAPYNVAQFQEWFGEEVDYRAIRRERVDLMKDMLAHEIPLKPQVPQTLEKLRQMGYSMAVVTATAQEQAVSNLKLAGLLPFFDHVISASMVKRGKPAPDVYLYACEVLGVQLENCYAVEDSPNGVMSAHAAGCRTIMIPDLSQPDAELSRLLYRKLDTFGELINILKK
ncbi:HAD family hydrolase [Eubacterium ramulus]|uniref:HAD family hydrolase n=1 Tax=Eubacterium ramulus TaxID=39490 RepID=UPI0022E0EE55|nr:HAD family phosphatase [Eubacterium ramulus]